MDNPPNILDALDGSPDRRLLMPGLDGSARAYVAGQLVRAGRLPVLVATSPEDAETLYRDLTFMLGTSDDAGSTEGVLFFGADEKSPYEAHSPDPRAVMERIATLYRLSRERAHVRAVVVTPRAFVRRLIPPSVFERAFEYLVAGEEIERDRLLENLVNWGYNSVNVVEDPGTFSVRGGIIDIFSPYHPRPIRVDLFGDEVESLRLFDPSTQRTEEELEDAIVLPAREVIFSPEIVKSAVAEVEQIAEDALIPTRRVRAVVEDIDNRIHFFGVEALLPLFHPEGLVDAASYLPSGDDVVYMASDTAQLTELLEDVSHEAHQGHASCLAKNEIALSIHRHVADGAEVLAATFGAARRIEAPDVQISGQDGQSPVITVRSESTSTIRGEIIKATRAEDEDILAPLTDRLRRWRSDGHVSMLVCHTRGQAERLKTLLEPKNVQVRLQTRAPSFDDLYSPQSKLRDKTVHAWIVLGELSRGFSSPLGKVSLVTEEELFGQRMKRRRTRKPAAGAFVSDLADLKPGDYVVHIDHGIGLYHGLTKLAVNGVDSDFLSIEYKGKDKLYLPVHRLRLVQKYATGGDGQRMPALSKLGSTSWGTTKRKVKDHLLKMAAGLLRLYAMREALEGFALQAPGPAFTEFEASFQFEPTRDQHKAITDVLEDLQKPKPMDRLICGDVGYGKTEVAMRAAMLAVQSKRQVAVLVPTTVLAAQHFHVFSERFRDHPVRIGIVSRFQTREQIKQTLRELKAGTLDIIIGTHRLVSKDVHFGDLGLLVVDEEQRFGVAVKEKLKKYRAKVHVMTLSATPIPRTLHMGMMGVRDLSVITTPPVDRLAVKTEVHKFSEEVIREAVLKEIRRGGQCFVVHNRVASIAAFGRMLEKLIPEARIVIGHGQMEEERLEKVMVDFMNKEYNVLLSTTIIESGIDIPSANTIIINRADRMGLAQLYQLRGRVGRSRVRGFAHFLIPAGNLSKDARKRIGVLQRFTELGAGFKVATHDLEIRGAGNILGKQQSGQIAAVGFQLYQTLMNEAIDELKGAAGRSLREPEINLPLPALLPDSYIPPPGERLSIYQRFNKADTDEATYDLLQEIGDLYGTPPAEVENLGQLMMVKQRLMRLGVLNLDFGPETKAMPPRLVLRFDVNDPGISPRNLVKFIEGAARQRKLLPDGRVMIYLIAVEDHRETVRQTLEVLDQMQLAAIDKA